MINELYNLSVALEKANIQTQKWHRKYRAIPNIREKTPCVCITISSEKVVKISSLDSKYSTILRKYGSNQGSYPCMNLAPLYRVTEDPIKKELNEIAVHPEKLTDETLEKIKGWCTEYNWGKKIQIRMVIRTEKVIRVSGRTGAEKFLRFLSRENCVICWMIMILLFSKHFRKRSAIMRTIISF